MGELLHGANQAPSVGKVKMGVALKHLPSG
jgi:hypothetical protein